MRALLFISLLSVVSNFAISQEYGSKNQFKIKGTVSFGATKSEIISSLGSPTSEQNDYNEMHEISVLVLRYGGSKLFLENGKLVSFEIYDNSLFIQYNGHNFRINDPISNLQPLFPESYSKRKMNLNEVDYPPSMLIKLKAIANSTSEVPVDEFIYIEFSESTSRITSISHRTY